MGKDLNHINMIGRLTRNAEIKHTNGGLCIANFTIAVNDIKKENNSWVDEVSFFDCSLFGKTAENVGKYLEQGKQVGIEGKLRQERWTNNQGEKRNRIKINVQTVQLLGGGNGMNQANKTEELFKSDDSSTENFDDGLEF